MDLLQGLPPLGEVGEPHITLTVASLYMLGGTFGAFAQKMMELEDAGERVTPWGYLLAHPWRVLNMIVSCEIALFVFHAMGELNIVTAIFTGYTCQSVAESLRVKAQAKLNKEDPK
jgi:hypothetical protein